MAGNVVEYVCPPISALAKAIVISTLSPETVGAGVTALSTGAFGSPTAWTANRLLMLPLLLTRPTLVDLVFWVNGSTTAGNTDVGVYDSTGTTKIVSAGSTANSGTGAVQSVNVTDTVLPASQLMWLTLGSDSGTQTFASNTGVNVAGMDLVGVKEQLSGWSSGLPSSVTLGVPTIAVLPFFGFTGRSVI